MRKATVSALRLVVVVLAVSAQGDHGDRSQPNQANLQQLDVHGEGRYLVREDGTPFLYLSDTAWELFHRATREQARQYLELRARQRFTVVHAVALAELDGITDPNAYGDLPLLEKDPSRPAVTGHRCLVGVPLYERRPGGLAREPSRWRCRR